MELELLILKGKTKGQTFPVEHRTYLSRSRGGIVLDDPKVSHKHARIEQRGAIFFLVDNNSSNGLIVGDKKVKEIQLVDGLEFQIGRTYIRVQSILQAKVVTRGQPVAPDGRMPTPGQELNETEALDETADLSTKTRSWSNQQSRQQRQELVFEDEEPTSAHELASEPPTTVQEVGDVDDSESPTTVHSPDQHSTKNIERSTQIYQTPKETVVASPQQRTPSHQRSTERKRESAQEVRFSDVDPGVSHQHAMKPNERLLNDDEEMKDVEPIDLINSMDGKGVSWDDHLYAVATELAKISRPIKGRSIVALERPITLSFFRGIQADTDWVLGYGPRKIGAQALDCNIMEPGAPGVCFEIIPTPKGTLFHTNHSQIVLYNGKSVQSQVVKSDDVISIVNTHIRIKVDDGLY